MAMTFNPGQVTLGRGNGSIPYLQNSPMAPGGSGSRNNLIRVGGGPRTVVRDTGLPASAPVPGPAPAAPAPGNTLSAETVRATGTGPFDATYRQNLATYAGGQFSRPGGNLSFDPTGSSLPFGQPTGGGSAPVVGMPSSLVGQALGGNPFSFTPPPPPAPAQDQFTDPLGWWRGQFNDNGNSFGRALTL